MESSLFLMIKNLYNSLKGNDHIIAEYILNNYSTLSNSSISQFASLVGTSEAAVIRFCKRLGLSGYAELKVRMIEDKSNGKNNFEDMTLDLNCTDPGQIVNKIFDNAIQHILITKKLIKSNEIEKVVNLMVNCDKTIFFAVGTSASIVQDAAYRFMRVGFSAQSATDPHIMLFSANNLTEKSIAFAVSHTGRSRETIESMKLAKSKGATTVCITSSRNSPLTKCCDISLVTSNMSQNFMQEAMTSRLAHIALLDGIFTALMLCHYPDYKNKIDSVHHILENARVK